MDNVVEIDSCRLCHGKDIPIILDFGRTALANSLVKAEDLDKPEFTAPLRLVQCSECGCVQLKDGVKPKILFKDYVYISNTNPNLVAHFNQYAKDVVAKIQPSLSSRILGIGGNSADLEVAFKNLWNNRVHLLKGGHGVFWQNSQKFNEILDHFLKDMNSLKEASSKKKETNYLLIGGICALAVAFLGAAFFKLHPST